MKRAGALIFLTLGVCIVGAVEALRISPLGPYVIGQLTLCAALAVILTSKNELKSWLRWDGAAALRCLGTLALISAAYVVATTLIDQFILNIPRAQWDFFEFYKPIYAEAVLKFGPFGAVALYGVMLWVAAPIGEELFFRGFLYARLRPMGRGIAFFIPSLLFGLRHSFQLTYFWPNYPIWLGINYCVFAFFLGWVLTRTYEKTGSLTSCMAAHLGINLILGPLGLLYFSGLIGHI